MKELDVLLERYLCTGWASSSPEQKALFEQLLELPDPELAAYLLGHVVPEQAPVAQLARLISTSRD
jgi:succinate dehydrogenase flavin-adding protein (antitoxin of CptAB toxin-antitoxin module)